MELSIRLAAPGLDDDDLLSRTIELRDLLTREGGLEEVEQPGVVAPGYRGAEIALGALVMSFVSSGLAAQVFDAIKSILNRDRSWSVEIERRDGRVYKLSGTNIDPRELGDFCRFLEDG